MREFVLIIVAGLGSSVLGAGFGWLVGWLSPEFIALLTQPQTVASPERFGAATGAIAGLFMGAVTMAFGVLIAAFRAWVARPAVDGQAEPLPVVDRREAIRAWDR